MTFRMIAQLWNTNTSAFVSCDADLTENYMYISMKFGTGVHVFCWEVGVFNRSSFQSVSYKCVFPVRVQISGFHVNILQARTFWNSTLCVLIPITLDWTRNLLHTRCGIWLFTIFHITYIVFQLELIKKTPQKLYLSFFFFFSIVKSMPYSKSRL